MSEVIYVAEDNVGQRIDVFLVNKLYSRIIKKIAIIMIPIDILLL